jgi:hypothetical protein
MKSFLIIDFETLDTRPSAVVLSLGAYYVDLDKDLPSYQDIIDTGYYKTFDVEEQVQDGRTISKDTLDWWKDVGEEAQHILKPSNDDVSYKSLIPSLREYISDYSDFFVFARSPSFDFSIIDDIIYSQKEEVLYPQWMQRDTRTWIECMSDYKIYNGFNIPDQGVSIIKHHALHDIAIDIIRMKMIVEA